MKMRLETTNNDDGTRTFREYVQMDGQKTLSSSWKSNTRSGRSNQESGVLAALLLITAVVAVDR